MKSIFKKIALVMALALIVTAFPVMNASAAEDPQVTPSITYYLGKTETAKLKTWNRAGMSWTFDVADESIATVDAQGYVTGLKVGTTEATCTFTSKATGDVVATKTATVKVRRNAEYIALGTKGKEPLNINEGTSGELVVGDVVENLLQYVVRTTGHVYEQGYKGAGYVQAWGDNRSKISDNVFITSSNPAVLSVNEGSIKAEVPGTATLTIEAKTWAKGEITAKAEYTITVKEKEVAPPEIEVYEDATLKPTVELTDKLTANGKDGVIMVFEFPKAATAGQEVQVLFEATRGAFAQDKVTLQDGKAYCYYVGPTSTVEVSAKLTATVVTGPKDLVGTQAKPYVLDFKPTTGENGGQQSSNVESANVIGSVVQYTDRITLFFDRNVDAATLWKDSKFDISIYDNYKKVGNAPATWTREFTKANFVNAVQGDTDASVTFILGVDAYGKNLRFTDNSAYNGTFVDKRGEVNGNGALRSILTGTITENTKPAVLSVNAINLKQIEIKFSEPMDPNTVTASAIAIDGVRLNDFNGVTTGNNWGVTGHRATVAMDTNVVKTSRDTFIVTLGLDQNGKQIYIPTGLHVLTIVEAADFAAETDKHLDNHNKIINSSLNFQVEPDSKIPGFTVEVQSPEQFKVDFNCRVETESPNDILKNLIKLEYEKTPNVWVDVSDFSQVYDVNDITATNDSANHLIIEVKKDWTTVLPKIGDNVATEKENNYYNFNFRVYLQKDKVYNVSNGNKNPEVAPVLGGKMKEFDFNAPEVVNDGGFKQNTSDTAGVYTVEFDEPIYIGNNKHALSGTQSYTSVELINAQIYAKDKSNNEVYDCVVSSPDYEHKKISVAIPKLTAGKQYYLVIRNVTDDLGNDKVHVFNIDEVKAIGTAPDNTDFYITKAYADKYYDYQGVNVKDTDAVAGNMQALYVYFSTAFSTADVENRTVLVNTNWTINGVTLPNDATIVAGVIGDTTDAGKKGVTILVPYGTITDINNTVITLNNNVLSANGKTLSGKYQVVTQYEK